MSDKAKRGVSMDEQASEPAAVAGVGAAMHGLIAELYPICRSITGNGVRRTLALINQRIPIATFEVPRPTESACQADHVGSERAGE